MSSTKKGPGLPIHQATQQETQTVPNEGGHLAPQRHLTIPQLPPDMQTNESLDGLPSYDDIVHNDNMNNTHPVIARIPSVAQMMLDNNNDGITANETYVDHRLTLNPNILNSGLTELSTLQVLGLPSYEDSVASNQTFSQPPTYECVTLQQ